MQLIAIIMLTIWTTSCNSQKREVRTNKVDDSVTKETASQIGTYVISAFEDSEGNLWFGTRVAERDNPDPEKRIGKGGVNKLVNNKMISFPEIKGFNDGDVYTIYKEGANNIWISTTKNGVYKYNGRDFKNYSVPISITDIMKDRHGIIWLAGAGGLYKINQKEEIINVTIKGPWK